MCYWSPSSRAAFYLLPDLCFEAKFLSKGERCKTWRVSEWCAPFLMALLLAGQAQTLNAGSKFAAENGNKANLKCLCCLQTLLCCTVSPTLATVALSKECFLWRNCGSLGKVSKDAKWELGAVAYILVNLMTSFEANTWRPKSDRLSGTDCHFHKGRYASVSDW